MTITSSLTTVPSSSNGLGRRALLGAGGLTALALAGCDALRTSPGPGDDESPNAAKNPPQAPMLADLVKAGELPPVEQRLPAEPLVIEPTERVGVYGGTWHGVLLGLQEPGYVYSHCQGDNLVRWLEHWTGGSKPDEIIPNIARSFEVSEDGREFTFHLRPEMKWSDGEPFTADDVVFAVDEVFLNAELRPATPSIILVDDGPAAVEKIDEHTVRVSFPSPAGLFLQTVATSQGDQLTHYARHYAEQFHADHNPDIDTLVAEAGVADWVELFATKFGPPDWGQNVDRPTLGAWRLKTAFGDGQRVVLERNPYYWKTDPDGSQLPYIDEVVFELVNDIEVMLLKGTNGEIDIEVPPKPRFTNPANKPVLAQGREQGGYRFVDGIASRHNIMILQLNLNHPDPAKRELFNNRDFRIGLSYALNRQEMIDVAMQQQGEPYQCAPLPESPFYDEELATQYLDYDVDLANEFLDKVAPERDGDDRRLGADGKPIRFSIEYAGGFRPEWTPILELVEEYWRAVGVDVNLTNQDRVLFIERTAANEHDVAVWHGDGGLSTMIAPHYVCPVSGDLRYAVAWKNWYLGGPEPIQEPPDEVKEQMRLYDQLKSTIDADEQARLLTEILQIAKEQFYVIGTARETEKYFIAKNDFRNVPDAIIEGWEYCTPAPTRTEQFFLDR